MSPLGLIVTVLGKFVPSLREQASHRYLSGKKLRNLERIRSVKSDCQVFFASSAGEYEQARPLIRRALQANPRLFPVIIFFSESGFRFAKAQGETLTYIKAPWDDLFHWYRLFKVLKPSKTFVVRYELWPAFLSVAKSWGPLYLVNGVASPSLEGKGIGSWLRSKLLRYFDQIFLVSESDQQFFENQFKSSSDILSVVGDSKYDRVRERISERQGQLQELSGKLSKSWPRKKRFIIGSAWHEDVKVFIDGFKLWAERMDEWQVIIAPHDISLEMVQWIVGYCQEQGLSVCTYSNLDSLGEQHQVLIVDALGILPELYGCVDVAMVGGAMHHRVHNVLEPAVRGLSLSFGPRYHTSKEAVLLVDKGLGQVLHSPEELFTWWSSLSVEPGSKNPTIMAQVKELCGASDAIMQKLEIGQN